MHDASAAIEAVLTATGAATVRPGSAFGLGFSDGAAIPFAGAADDLLGGGPAEQVVVDDRVLGPPRRPAGPRGLRPRSSARG